MSEKSPKEIEEIRRQVESMRTPKAAITPDLQKSSENLKRIAEKRISRTKSDPGLTDAFGDPEFTDEAEFTPELEAEAKDSHSSKK
jgi:hypothetical protein